VCQGTSPELAVVRVNQVYGVLTSGVRMLDAVVVSTVLAGGWVPGAHADVCDLAIEGSSGVVRAAVEAKGRMPSTFSIERLDKSLFPLDRIAADLHRGPKSLFGQVDRFLAS
jgi:hypothetical protein